MNFHSNIAHARLLDSIRDSPQVNKESKEVYESILQKHFQIIQSFLEKINELYNKHEEFENKLTGLDQKVQKLETSTKNIHYEFRTTHLLIDKKLNNMTTEFNHIQEQIIQMEMPIESYLSSSHFLAKSSHLQSRRKKQRKKSSRKDSDNYKITVLSGDELNQSQPIPKREDDIKNDQMLELGLGFQTYKKYSRTGSYKQKAVAFDGISSQLFQRGDNASSVTIIRDSNDLAQEGGELQQEQEDERERICDEQWMRAQIKEEIDGISQSLQDQIKMVCADGSKIKQELEAKMLEHLSATEQSVLQKVDQKIQSLRTQLQITARLIKQDIFLYNKQLNEQFDQLSQKLAERVEKSFFETTLNNLSGALSEQFAKQDKFYSNKLQTKRAIEFLQNKMNKFIAQQFHELQVKTKKHVGGVGGGTDDPSLKINKYDQGKKLDCSSEKSIKDKNQESNAFNYKSMETSMHEIDTTEKQIAWKEEQGKFKRVISNITGWRNSDMGRLTPEENKVVRSSSKYKDYKDIYKEMRSESPGSKRMSSGPEFQVNVKEWKQRVVKILKKEDRRKRKVTFR